MLAANSPTGTQRNRYKERDEPRGGQSSPPLSLRQAAYRQTTIEWTRLKREEGGRGKPDGCTRIKMAKKGRDLPRCSLPALAHYNYNNNGKENGRVASLGAQSVLKSAWSVLKLPPALRAPWVASIGQPFSQQPISVQHSSDNSLRASPSRQLQQGERTLFQGVLELPLVYSVGLGI